MTKVEVKPKRQVVSITIELDPESADILETAIRCALDGTQYRNDMGKNYSTTARLNNIADKISSALREPDDPSSL